MNVIKNIKNNKKIYCSIFTITVVILYLFSYGWILPLLESIGENKVGYLIYTPVETLRYYSRFIWQITEEIYMNNGHTEPGQRFYFKHAKRIEYYYSNNFLSFKYYIQGGKTVKKIGYHNNGAVSELIYYYSNGAWKSASYYTPTGFLYKKSVFDSDANGKTVFYNYRGDEIASLIQVKLKPYSGIDILGYTYLPMTCELIFLKKGKVIKRGKIFNPYKLNRPLGQNWDELHKAGIIKPF